MLDIKFLRENPDVVKQNIKNKFQDRKLPLVDEVIELDKENREIKQEVQALRADRNKLSKQIGALMGQGKKEEAEEVKKQVTASADRIEELSEREKVVEEKIKEIWAWLKKKEIYTSEFPEELDVAIWLDADAVESFFEYFGNDENPVPARIYQNAVLVLFSDVLDFKVTGMQIWSFRPHGMREEW